MIHTPLLARKAMHMLLAVLFACLSMYTLLSVLYTLIGVLALVFVGALFFRVFDPLRKAEQASFGELFFVLGVFVTAVLYLPNNIDAFVAGMLVLGFADTLAALVGRKWSIATYTVLGETRSYGGSFTVLAVSTCILSVFGVPPLLALLSGWIIAGVEALMPHGSDNLMLPIVTAMLIQALV